MTTHGAMHVTWQAQEWLEQASDHRAHASLESHTWHGGPSCRRPSVSGRLLMGQLPRVSCQGLRPAKRAQSLRVDGASVRLDRCHARIAVPPRHRTLLLWQERYHNGALRTGSGKSQFVRSTAVI